MVLNMNWHMKSQSTMPAQPSTSMKEWMSFLNHFWKKKKPVSPAV